MKRALINPERCQNCVVCQVQEQCPMRALFRELPSDRPWIDLYHCSGCLRCKLICPHSAIDEMTHPCGSGRRLGW